jgi:hypothetical protein
LLRDGENWWRDSGDFNNHPLNVQNQFVNSIKFLYADLYYIASRMGKLRIRDVGCFFFKQEPYKISLVVKFLI